VSRASEKTKSTSYQARGIGVAAAAATLWPDAHTLRSTRFKIRRHPPTKLARFGLPSAGGGTPWPGPPRRRVFQGGPAAGRREGWGTTVVHVAAFSGWPGGGAARRLQQGGEGRGEAPMDAAAGRPWTRWRVGPAPMDAAAGRPSAMDAAARLPQGGPAAGRRGGWGTTVVHVAASSGWPDGGAARRLQHGGEGCGEGRGEAPMDAAEGRPWTRWRVGPARMDAAAGRPSAMGEAAGRPSAIPGRTLRWGGRDAAGGDGRGCGADGRHV
jgi:hypothetical protein